MTLSILNLFTVGFDAFFDKFESVGPPEVSDEERRRIRGMVVTHDPAACNSEYGAYALMAMFPQQM